MALKDDFRSMAETLAADYCLPAVKAVFLPRFHKGGQPRDAQFMALALGDGSAGVSYVLHSDECCDAYERLRKTDVSGQSPLELARGFGSDDSLENMLGLAAINAMCQHVMKVSGFKLDTETDSTGLLNISAGDRIGMVGLFGRLIPAIEAAGADYVVIELNEKLIEQYPHYPITLDPSELRSCNKVLCTSITVFNNTLDSTLEQCSDEASVAIIGPTAGYFPDPLFAKGVDVVGGTSIHNGDLFMQLIAEGKKWGPSTRKFCFQRSTYPGIPDKKTP